LEHAGPRASFWNPRAATRAPAVTPRRSGHYTDDPDATIAWRPPGSRDSRCLRTFQPRADVAVSLAQDVKDSGRSDKNRGPCNLTAGYGYNPPSRSGLGPALSRGHSSKSRRWTGDEFVSSGRLLFWHSVMFVFKAERYLAVARSLRPRYLAPSRAAFLAARRI